MSIQSYTAEMEEAADKLFTAHECDHGFMEPENCAECGAIRALRLAAIREARTEALEAACKEVLAIAEGRQAGSYDDIMRRMREALR